MSSASGRRLAANQTSSPPGHLVLEETRAAPQASAKTSRATQKTKKRANTSANPAPLAKRQCVRRQPEDSSASSGKDAEVFDEVPLTRADIDS